MRKVIAVSLLLGMLTITACNLTPVAVNAGPTPAPLTDLTPTTFLVSTRTTVPIPTSTEQPVNSFCSTPLWLSPDEERSAFVCNNSLWLADSDGANANLVIMPDSDKQPLSDISWAPNSRYLVVVYTPHRADRIDIPTQIDFAWVDTVNNSAHNLIHARTSFPYFIVWSEDGSRFAIAYNEAAIFVFDTQSSEQISVLNLVDNLCSGMYSRIIWSPDNEMIAHTHVGNGRYGRRWLCVSDVFGETIYLRLNGGVLEPVWDETGTYLYILVIETNRDNINPEAKSRLVRFDPKTKSIEVLVDLDKTLTNEISTISLTPDNTHIILNDRMGNPLQMLAIK